MIKVLMVRPGPAFSVEDVYQGYVRAFQGLGCAVADLNFDDRLTVYASALHHDSDGTLRHMFDIESARHLAQRSVLAACYDGDPDVVVIVYGALIDADMVETIRRHTNVVVVHTESPYEDDRQLGLASSATLNVINDPTNLDRFAAVADSVFLPACYDPAVHCPGPVDKRHVSDFCFVGSGYPSRIAFLEQVDWSGVDVSLAGSWRSLHDESPLRRFVAHPIENWCDNADTVALYRGAAASVNLYRREADRPELSAGWAMGPREVELAAVGCFYLTEPRGENRQVLPTVPTFDDPADFGDKLRWYLANPAERTRIAGEARAAVAGRTFAANAARILQTLYP